MADNNITFVGNNWTSVINSGATPQKLMKNKILSDQTDFSSSDKKQQIKPSETTDDFNPRARRGTYLNIVV